MNVHHLMKEYLHNILFKLDRKSIINYLQSTSYENERAAIDR